MSRPFSYNDEYFTVIGNLLIIHIPFEGPTTNNQTICKVPPEIVKRIKYRGFGVNYNKNPYSPIFNIGCYIDFKNNFKISHQGNFTDGEFFSIIELKDI